MTTPKEDFMAAMRGLPGHHVTAALNTYHRGVNWTKCSKGHIAECYENAAMLGERAPFRWLAFVDLQELAKKARNLGNRP